MLLWRMLCSECFSSSSIAVLGKSSHLLLAFLLSILSCLMQLTWIDSALIWPAQLWELCSLISCQVFCCQSGLLEDLTEMQQQVGGGQCVSILASCCLGWAVLKCCCLGWTVLKCCCLGCCTALWFALSARHAKNPNATALSTVEFVLSVGF